MQVNARSRNTGVTQRGLHEVNGRAPLKCVAGVRMTQPMRRYVSFDAGSFGRLPHSSLACR
jgi:hypothetical protein